MSGVIEIVLEAVVTFNVPPRVTFFACVIETPFANVVTVEAPSAPKVSAHFVCRLPE